MKVYLDNILLKRNPQGLSDISEVIELDLDLHGYVHYFDLPLTFVGDGFKYLYDLKITDGFCRKVELRIEVPTQQGTNVVTGYLFLTDCKFNHTKKTVECEVTDSTYGIFLSEAKELKISPLADISRDGTTITAVTPVGLTLFAPSTGADLATDAYTFKIAEIYEHLIKYLSNNTLQFSQSYFTAAFNFYFCNNYYMRNRGNVPDLQFSFDEIQRGCFKLFGLWFKLDNTTIPATFTLVQGESNFFEDYDSITWNNIRDLKEEFYPERFFSTVGVGDSDAIIERGSTYQLPTVPLVGFREETYNAANDCVLENTLDLKSEWVIDHNKIEQIVVAGEDSETPVLIYGDASDNAQKGTYGKDGVMRYYNEELLNFKVLERHNLPSGLSQALGADVSGFRAYAGSDLALAASTNTTPYPFDDTASGYDTGTNYNTVTYRYVVPQAGSYKFLVNLEYLVAGLQGMGANNTGGRVDVDVYIYRRKTGTGAILAQSQVMNIVHLVTSTTRTIDQGTAEFFCEATDYVDVRVDVTFLIAGAANSLTIYGVGLDDNAEVNGSYFETVFTFNNGGTVDLAALLDYKASALKFDGFPINATHWNSIKENPTQGIHINNGGGNSLCWVKLIKRNLKTGKSDCEMISSPLLTQL
jgi:hypothetical protein